MSKPIFKVYMGKPSNAWYSLTKEQQDALMQKVMEAQAKYGIKTLINCDSSWASDAYTFFGVEEFPSIEVMQSFYAEMSEIGWLRYIENTQSILGTSNL